MKLAEFLNDDTCQIFLAIIVGIVICYFIFGSCGSCSIGGCSRRDGFSVGGQPSDELQFTIPIDVQDTLVSGSPTWSAGNKIPCSMTDVNVGLGAIIRGACCDDTNEECIDGAPTTCDQECYKILTSLEEQCRSDPIYSDYAPINGPIDTARKMCIDTNPTLSPPPTTPPPPPPPPPGGAGPSPPSPPALNCDFTNQGQVAWVDYLIQICDTNTNNQIGLDECGPQTNCREEYIRYKTHCQEQGTPINPVIWKEIDTVCDPPQQPPQNSPPPPPSQPKTVIPEDIAKDMFTDSQYATIRSNLSASGINTASELNDHGIYPLVLHSGSFTGSVVFGGNTTRDFTTVHLMNGSNVMRNGLTLGSIAQAQASIFVSASNVSGQDSAESLEMQEFCGPGGVYGGRIDPGAKMVSEPTFNDNPDMCGMNAIASLGVTDYRNAVENRIRPLVNDNYATEIGGSYKSDTQIPVAKVDTKYIDVSQMQPDTSGYVHIVINFPNGAPNSDGSSVAGSRGTYLVIMSTGLSDGSNMELAKQTPMQALRSLRELQYLVQKSQTDVTQFMDAQYDPYYSASGTVTCSEGGCSLTPLDPSAGSFKQVQPNEACGQAHAEIQTYGLMLVKLKNQDGSGDGYQYLTPDDLIRTTNLEVTPDGEGIIDLVSEKTYRATGNFFIFENNGIKYIVPKHVSTNILEDILGSPECDTRQSPECCQKIIEQGSMPDLAMQNPNLHRYCNTLINLGTSTSGNGNAPGAGNTPPPSTGTGGGGSSNTAPKYCNLVGHTTEGYNCPSYKPVIKEGSGIFNDQLSFESACCELPLNCTTGKTNNYNLSAQPGMTGVPKGNICEWLCEPDNQGAISGYCGEDGVSTNCCACDGDGAGCN